MTIKILYTRIVNLTLFIHTHIVILTLKEVIKITSQKRVMPNGKELMKNSQVDFRLWGMLQTMSYLSPDKIRFVYKQHEKYGKLTQQHLTDLYNNQTGDDSISLSTMKRRLKAFKELEMLAEGVVTDNKSKNVKAFILLQNFETFEYIELDTLEYLLHTATTNVLKVYIYLLGRYIFTQKNQEKYSFTLAEVAENIGLKDYNNGNTSLIRDCLNSLMAVGLLECKQYYQTTSEGMPTPRLRLVCVNKTYNKTAI